MESQIGTESIKIDGVYLVAKCLDFITPNYTFAITYPLYIRKFSPKKFKCVESVQNCTTLYVVKIGHVNDMELLVVFLSDRPMLPYTELLEEFEVALHNTLKGMPFKESGELYLCSHFYVERICEPRLIQMEDVSFFGRRFALRLDLLC